MGTIMEISEYVKDNLSLDEISELLNNLGLEHTLNNNSIRMCCPFHNGNNPTSFSIKEGFIWYCFTGCKEGGNLIKFFKKYYNTESEEEIISNIVENVTIKDTKQRVKQETPYTPTLFPVRILGKLVALNKYRGFTKETLWRYSVVLNKSHNNVVFPIKDKKGDIYGATCRTLNPNYKEQKMAKWVHYPPSIRTSHFLYGIDVIENPKKIFICEGCVDVLNLYQNGFNGVAIYGTKMSVEQMNMLMQFPLCKKILALDGDKSGVLGTLKILKKYPFFSVAKIPWGTDIGALSKLEIDSLEILTMEEFYEYYNFLLQHQMLE